MGISVSLVLIAVGAILTWAVTTTVSGIDLNVVGVILMIVEKYRGVATAKQGRVLDRVLNDHIVLLAKPMSRDGRSGGHRIGGFKRQGDGLVGPALSHGASVRVETVNQTAVVLLGLQRLVENPLALRLLGGDFAEGDVVLVDAADGELVFEAAEAAAAATA